jgi:hypothetical protein
MAPSTLLVETRGGDGRGRLTALGRVGLVALESGGGCATARDGDPPIRRPEWGGAAGSRGVGGVGAATGAGALSPTGAVAAIIPATAPARPKGLGARGAGRRAHGRAGSPRRTGWPGCTGRPERVNYPGAGRVRQLGRCGERGAGETWGVGTGIRLPTGGEKVKAQKGEPATARRRPTASTACGRGAAGGTARRRPTATTGCRRGGRGDTGEEGRRRAPDAGEGPRGARREEGQRREVDAGGRAAGTGEEGRRREVDAGRRAARGGPGGRPPDRQQRGLKAKMPPEGH